MGFRSFWEDLRSPKVKEIKGNAKSTTSYPPTSKSTRGPRANNHYRLESGADEEFVELAKEKPKGRGSGLNKRRSFFRGKPDDEQDIPATPRLKHSKSEYFQKQETRSERPRTSGTADFVSRPDTAPEITADDDRRKSKRISLSHRLSRTFSKTNLRNDEQSVVPPMPPVPTSINASAKPATVAMPSAEKRKSRRMSGGEALTKRRSQIHPGKRRSFIWASSNEDSNDVPPTPALMMDYTSTSESARSTVSFDRNNSTTTYARSIDTERRPLHISTMDMNTMPTRPVSSYTPRSAAKGFLSSTNGASEATRRSWRKSDYPMVCLTDEHRQEWEKLKQLMSALESLPAAPNIEEIDPDRRDDGVGKFQNSDALAALQSATA